MTLESAAASPDRRGALSRGSYCIVGSVRGWFSRQHSRLSAQRLRRPSRWRTSTARRRTPTTPPRCCRHRTPAASCVRGSPPDRQRRPSRQSAFARDRGVAVNTVGDFLPGVKAGWQSRVADNGKGMVWQAPGSTSRANMLRVMEPTGESGTAEGLIDTRMCCFRPRVNHTFSSPFSRPSASMSRPSR